MSANGKLCFTAIDIDAQVAQLFEANKTGAVVALEAKFMLFNTSHLTRTHTVSLDVVQLE